MPSLHQLPCELVVAVLERLDHLQNLAPALLSCRHVYTAFKESYGVEHSILRRQITSPLLPYAIAVLVAQRLHRPLAGSSIIDSLLDELYGHPSRLAARLSLLSTRLLHKLSRTHDAIHNMVIDFATTALDHISPEEASPTPNQNGTSTRITLSPLEYFHLCRAFYRMDLFYTIARDGEFENPVTQFFSRHPPWENEQLVCVYDYLETTFMQASRDTIAHDVFYGELSLSYLDPVEDNLFYQTWLAQGIEFVHTFTETDTYEAKVDMLMSATGKYSDTRQINFAHVLWELRDDEKYDGRARAVSDWSEDELRSNVTLSHPGQAADEHDTDCGPYEAWRDAHFEPDTNTLWISLMWEGNAWLRERAYVFWDWARMQEQFRDGFGEYPGYRDRFFPDPQEYEEMVESFDGRSKIWQKAGDGYWMKGDWSRIVWPSAE